MTTAMGQHDEARRLRFDSGKKKGHERPDDSHGRLFLHAKYPQYADCISQARKLKEKAESLGSCKC